MTEAQPLTRVVRIDALPKEGQTVTIEASAPEREALAKLYELPAIAALTATLRVGPAGHAGARVTGAVHGELTQVCVVTLEPLGSDIAEDIALLFEPPPPQVERAADADDGDDEDQSRKPERNWNKPEPLIDGVVDLGALATEFLILGLDPYPRKPGAVFEPPADLRRDPGPFAALAKLAKDGNGH